MFDTSLLFTVGLIFLATLVGSYLRSRRRDPCLDSFAGFHVTLERGAGKTVWGILEAESTGLELHYRDDVQDAKHLESSYILYGHEFDDVQAIYRFADELTPENREKRRQDIEHSFHPGPIDRAKRNLRRFVGTASESLSEVVSVLVGRAKKPAGRYITDKGETYLNQLSSNLIGHAGGVFDPLLERYIGQKVVVEIMENDEVHEHVGIFKNYSPDFMEILDVQFPQKQAIAIGPEGCAEDECVQAQLSGTELSVSNPSEPPVLLHTILCDGEEEMINSVINGGEEVILHLPKECENLELRVRVVRELDMIVPRTRAVLRHRAERYEAEILPEIVFDVGFILNPDAKLEAREKRLREKLDGNPNDALAAANLGTLLMQKQQYEQAERWLLHALTMRLSLPDSGRKATLQLREVSRRRYGQAAGPPTPRQIRLGAAALASAAAASRQASGNANGASGPDGSAPAAEQTVTEQTNPEQTGQGPVVQEETTVREASVTVKTDTVKTDG